MLPQVEEDVAEETDGAFVQRLADAHLEPDVTVLPEPEGRRRPDIWGRPSWQHHPPLPSGRGGAAHPEDVVRRRELVFKLYTTTELTTLEIAEKLGVGRNTVWHDVTYLRDHEGMPTRTTRPSAPDAVRIGIKVRGVKGRRVEERRRKVAKLHEDGLTVNEIVEETGSSLSTVRADLRELKLKSSARAGARKGKAGQREAVTKAMTFMANMSTIVTDADLDEADDELLGEWLAKAKEISRAVARVRRAANNKKGTP